MKRRSFGAALPAMLLTAAALIFLSSCSGPSETASPAKTDEAGTGVAVETAGDAAAKEDGGEVEIRTEDATVKAGDGKVEYESGDGETRFEVGTESSVELPEGYPGDIAPVYPNGRIVLAGVEGDGFGVSIVTDDSIEDIFKYYKANIRLDVLAGEQQTADMAMIMGMAGDKNVTVMATVNNLYDEGKNLITIAIGK